MNIRRWILAALALFGSSAYAFIDPPIITPERPTTEMPIEVAIRNGLCDALLNYTVAIVDDDVEMTITKIPTQDDPFCNNTIYTTVFELPLLSAGQHPLSIFLLDSAPPDAEPVLWFQTTLDVANVGGVPLPPAPVSALTGWFPLAVFLLGVLLLAFRYRKLLAPKHPGFLILIDTTRLGVRRFVR